MTDAAALANLRRQVGGVLRSPRAAYGFLGGLVGVILVLGLSSLASVIMDGWIQRDLDLRSTLIFRAISDRATQPGGGDMQAVEADMQKIVEDERIFGLAFCTREGKLAFATSAIPRPFDCAPFSTPRANEGVTLRTPEGDHVRFNRFALTMGGTPGQLLVAQDLDEARSGERDALTYATAALAAVAFGLGFLAVAVIYTLRQSWMASLRGAIAESIRTNTAEQAPVVTSGEGPVDRRISALLGDLRVRRKFVHGIYVRWSPDSLRQLLLDQLPDVQVMIVSNREPYIHNRVDGEIELQTPASGLVSALEPVMRACRGVWIAHGGGSADRETVDKHSRLDGPARRPHLFAAPGLAHRRGAGRLLLRSRQRGFMAALPHRLHPPDQFREPDWAMYRAVNQRFADVVGGGGDEREPDRPGAGLPFRAAAAHDPRMPCPRRPSSPSGTSPGPTPKPSRICPWREEILDGLLGSSILGFHTQFHCNNFFDSVDRFIESRIDHENSLVSFGGRETLVRPYPISIEWPPRGLLNQPSIEQCRINVRERFGLAPDTRIAVGVERFDYTKGILDRMRAVDDLLAMSPQWRGKFVLIQVAAPTRSKLEAYSELEKEAEDSPRRSTPNISATAGNRSCWWCATTSRAKCSNCSAPPTSAWCRACTTA